MGFHLIDLENWERREFYEHFIREVRCTYSTCVQVDITSLKKQRLYPPMLWLLTQTVNGMPEFRTALTAQGLGTAGRQQRENFSIPLNKNASGRAQCG